MTPYQATLLVLKLFSLWLLAGMGGLFVRAVAGASDNHTVGEFIATFGPAIALPLGLYIYPKPFARILLRGIDSTPHSSASPELWFTFGRSLLGLWFVGSALPEIVLDSLLLVRGPTDPNTVPHLISFLFKSACGSILLAGLPRPPIFRSSDSEDSK
jgi:hypothetical protein